MRGPRAKYSENARLRSEGVLICQEFLSCQKTSARLRNKPRDGHLPAMHRANGFQQTLPQQTFKKVPRPLSNARMTCTSPACVVNITMHASLNCPQKAFIASMPLMQDIGRSIRVMSGPYSRNC